MKALSPKISKEIWIKPNYAIVRFMKSKIAFKTTNHQPILCTFKIVNEKNCPLEMQIHLRFNGKDYWNKKDDILDLDLYIPLKEFVKLKNI